MIESDSPLSSKVRDEAEKARRFFNRTALIYPIIERNLFPEYRRALDILDLNPKLNVLDLATGTGILAASFAERGHRATGYDIAEKMLKRANKKFPSIEFEQFDLTNLSVVPSNSFDIVTMGYFLHGVSPGIRSQVLRESGRIASEYVVIFDYCCRGNWLVDLIEWIEGSHYKEFTDLNRVEELQSVGLQVQRELNLSENGSVWLCKKNRQ